MYAVPNQYGCCLYFLDFVLRYCMCDFEMVPVAPIITGTVFFFSCFFFFFFFFFFFLLLLLLS
jgi:hypothetical protein